MIPSTRFGNSNGYGHALTGHPNDAKPVCNVIQDNKVYPLLVRTVPDELELTRQIEGRLATIEQQNANMLAALNTGFQNVVDALNRRFNGL